MYREQVLEKYEKDPNEVIFSPYYRMALARAVRSLTGIEKTVLSFIVESSDPYKGGASWLSQSKIAREIGASRATVNSAYKKFLARGLISDSMGDLAKMYRQAPTRGESSSTCLVYLNFYALIEQSAPDWCELPAAPADPVADDGADDTVYSGEVIDPAPPPSAAPAGLGATQPALAAPPLAHLRPTPADEEQAGSAQPVPSAPAAHLALAGPTSTASVDTVRPIRPEFNSQNEEENRKQQLAWLEKMMDAEQSA